jgi:hypothetical protein
MIHDGQYQQYCIVYWIGFPIQCRILKDDGLGKPIQYMGIGLLLQSNTYLSDFRGLGKQSNPDKKACIGSDWISCIVVTDKGHQEAFLLLCPYSKLFVTHHNLLTKQVVT